jgi:hypothetical protein
MLGRVALFVVGVALIVAGVLLPQKGPDTLKVSHVRRHGYSLQVDFTGPVEQLETVELYAGLTSGYNWHGATSERIEKILRLPGVELLDAAESQGHSSVALKVPAASSGKALRLVLRLTDGSVHMGPDVSKVVYDGDSYSAPRSKVRRLKPKLMMLGLLAIVFSLTILGPRQSGAVQAQA